MYLLAFLNTALILIVLVELFRLGKQVKELHDVTPDVTLLTDMAEAYGGQAKLMELVEDIHNQFTTDGGLSMRDAVNRLDEAAKKQYAAGELLKVITRDDRLKAELDREQLQRLLIELYRLTIKVESTMATTARIELAAVEVADDLAAAHKRADEVTIKDHGAAADAAAQQTEKERESNIEEQDNG